MSDGKRCNARRRRLPGRCRAFCAPGSHRCRQHGGTSQNNGRFPQRRTNVAANAARLAKQAIRRALGLPAPWGRRKKTADLLTDREKVLAMTDQMLAILPEAQKPADQMTPAELLTDATRHGLVAARDIVMRYDPESDIKERNLVSSTAAWMLRVLMRVAEQDFRRQESDQMRTMFERLEQLRAADAAPKAKRKPA